MVMAVILGISFFLGLFVGSFLNVVIYRLGTGEQFVRGRSHCPYCGNVLSWYELVPLVSFFIQKGICRACNKPISMQYPLVELATGILFAFTSWRIVQHIDPFSHTFFYPLSSIFYLLIISGLIVIFVYDLKHYIIPDSVLLFLIGVIALAYLIGVWDGGFVSLYKISQSESIWNFSPFGGSPVGREALFNGILSGFLSAFPFLAIVLVSGGRWMGLGDVKFAFSMGLLLGLPSTAVAMFLAVMAGAIVGVALIVLGKKTLKSTIPFGPFLVLGTGIALFCGNDVWHFYLHMIGIE